MSLFQVREWWATRNGSGEEFDHGCLCVGNVDNDQGDYDKIVTGSFEGYLRMYFPRQTGFKAEDLLLEVKLDFPILRVAIGKFIQNSSHNALAVLHPRKLVVYQVESMGNNYSKLSKRYDHSLGDDGNHFTAFNLVFGSFGGAQGKDFLCVQSLDGQLQVFEQDNYAFTRYIETCLIPGPLCYASPIDSFITANSEMCIESYKYQVLASSFKRSRKSIDEGKQSGEQTTKLQIDWKTNLGEPILDIQLARYCKGITSSQFDILVLGQQTLFFLKAQGTIRMQKRLGYDPSVCCLYNRSDSDSQQGSNQNIIIGTHTNKWMIYKDTQMIWSACSTTTPVDLAIGRFGNNSGMVVALDEEGMLSVNYLGTDPPCTAVGAIDLKEINYQEIDNEHRKLLKIIRENQGDTRVEPREKILLRAQVTDILDSFDEFEEEEDEHSIDLATSKTGSVLQVTVRLFISYTGNDCIQDINIAIETPSHIIPSKNSFVISSIDGKVSTPLVVSLRFRASNKLLPTSRLVRFAAVYLTNSGQPRTSLYDIQLPLCICVCLIPPVKSAAFKFTLETNKPSPLLIDLYEDLLTQPGMSQEQIQKITESSANVLSFQYYNEGEVTILVSKNSGRYRIQGTAMEFLSFIANDLIFRLQKFYSSSKSKPSDNTNEPFSIIYEEPLPLADFFSVIDEHFECRKKIRIVSSEINDSSHQMRVIEKRLLLRFKERNPAPLQNLDLLLNETYERLLSLSNEMEALQKNLTLISNRLSCSIEFILFLMRYRFAMDEESFDILKAYLSSTVSEENENGWEELTEAAMTSLLRTVLAKQSTEAIIGSQVMEFPEDTKKLKKHITIVCNRLAKGVSIKG